jgi:hypothetical protein
MAAISVGVGRETHICSAVLLNGRRHRVFIESVPFPFEDLTDPSPSVHWMTASNFASNVSFSLKRTRARYLRISRHCDGIPPGIWVAHPKRQ